MPVSRQAPGDMPVAIIGIGCRFPGGARTPSGLWQLLLDGRETVSPVPADRWDAGELMRYQDPRVAARYGRGCFVEGDVWAWEPTAFSVAPGDGAIIDPQHRMAVECAWEAVEHAGLPVASLRGSDTGVFLGLYALDDVLSRARPVRDWIDGLSMFGSSPGNAPARITFGMDLRGPAMTVETLCSSGLTALHVACRALASGECSLALAGASMLMTAPETLHYEAQWLTSATGHSYAFDERADGFVRGEGCGMVLLKPLDRALANGDRVLAVVRGTALSGDGQAERLTAPSTQMQQVAFRTAVERAGIDPGDVGLVEAHGPGTAAGDPTEYTSVNAVYGRGRGRCALGSVKTNLGHSEPVSGIAGLIKTVWALREGLVPRNLNFRRWNPAIPLDPDSRLFVPVETEQWPVESGSRLAAVCSYGLSGTNAHAVLEQPPTRRPGRTVRTGGAPPEGQAARAAVREPLLFLLSAPSAQSLPVAAGALADVVQSRRPDPADLAHTLAVRRSHATHRLAVLAAGRTQLVERLREFARERAGTDVVTGSTVLDGDRPGPVFVFTGQGSQSPGMCQGLLDVDAVFTAVVDEIEPMMREEAGISLREMISHPELLVGVERIQPTLFAVQIALARMWESWGIRPAAVIGQSLGEITAAVVAGALSLRDGLVVNHRRAVLANRINGGLMASVLLDADRVQADIEAAGAVGVSLAVLTSPGTCVIAGDARQVADLVATWQDKDVSASLVQVDYASHSPHVDPIIDDIHAQLAHITPAPAGLKVYTTAYEDPRAEVVFDAVHWAHNLRHPVRLVGALAAALEDGHRLFVECSPHPLVVRAVTETARSVGVTDAVAVGSLRRGSDDRTAFATHVAAAHCAGAAVDFAARYRGGLVDVPATIWHRVHQRPDPPYELVAPQLVGARQHSLLGGHVADPAHEGRHLWQTPVGPARVPWLADHAVAGVPVMPGTGLAEMMLSAARHALASDRIALRDVTLETPLPLDPEPVVTTRCTIDGDQAVLDIVTHEGSAILTHARATAHRLGTTTQAAATRPATATPDVPQPVNPGPDWQEISPADVYRTFRERHNVAHGTAFNGLERVRLHPTQDLAVAQVRIDDSARISSWMMTLHPALADEVVQTAGSIWLTRYPLAPGPVVVVGFDEIRVLGHTGHTRHTVVRLHEADDVSCRASCLLTDDNGTPVAEITGLRLANVTPKEEQFAARLSHLAWAPDPLTAQPAGPEAAARRDGSWLILAEKPALWAPRLTRTLGEHTATARLLPFAPDGENEPDWEELLADAANRDLDGIVLALDAATPAPDPVHVAQTRTARLAALFRALLTHGHGAALRVVVRATGPEPAVGGLRGLLRCAAFEAPHLQPTLIDFASAADLTHVAAELTADGPSREISWRNGIRHTARLRAGAPTEARTPGNGVRPGASYLVTGGLSGVGLATAQWLAGQGAGHLVLCGRSEPSPQAVAALDRMRADGTKVSVVRGDIADPKTAADAVARATADAGELRGVVHSAAVVEDATLATADAALLDRVWRGKARGAWALHEATLFEDLDFFAVHSSLASLAGSPGQAMYAAANAFTDELIDYRAAQGLPATAVHWGAWARIGRGQHLADQGFAMIKPSDGTDALGRVLASGHTRMAYSPLDLTTWIAPYPHLANAPLFQELATETILDPGADQHILQELREADTPARRRTLIEDFIVGQVGDILSTADGHINRSTSLILLGLDSLRAVQLQNRLQRALDTTIESGVIWVRPTAAGLAAWIAERMGLDSSAEDGTVQ
ncbi:type I polyketide synthase [Streptomyces sp. NPDC006733]|uniref:type I polyketide synthase n=1 Tax=Streptomyces sp. NPDC006733 TaxID=3155460 RepID=UPI0033E3FCD2